MQQTPRLVVIHTTESLTDLDGPDTGAENVAAWFTRNDVQASYHTIVDSDSTVRCLPAGLDELEVHTAWHASAWNVCSVGISIAMRAADWPTVPTWWADRVHARLADEVAAVCRRWSIPAAHITLADAEAGAAGLIGHGQLDPVHRSDPGADFDWQRLVADVAARLGGPDPDPDPITEDDDMTLTTWTIPDGTRYIGDPRTGASRRAQEAFPEGTPISDIHAAVGEMIRAGALRDLGALGWQSNWVLRTSPTWGLDV